MIGKPISVVTDEIGQRFDCYKSALKKHGIKTRVETLSSLLDLTPKMAAFGTAAALHFAGLGDFLAAVAGSGMTIGDILMKMAKVKIAYDEGLSKLRSEHPEVAFLAPLAASDAQL